MSFLSRGHTLQHTFKITEKGKNKTLDNRFEDYTDNRSHYYKWGFSTAQRDRNAHTLAANNATLSSYGL